jgi:hypothetical protein
MKIVLLVVTITMMLASMPTSAANWCDQDCVKKCIRTWGSIVAEGSDTHKCIYTRMVCSKYPKAPCYGSRKK